MGKGVKMAVVVGVLVLLVGGWLIKGYNGVIRMDEDVKEKWAQVENQLKRRYDLIPNLVETVKGYAAHEREIFTAIAEARTKYFAAQSVGEKVEASRGLEGALSRLLMLQENYPQLKANENFLKLQDSLEGTENRIAVERRTYNEVAQRFNTMIRTFPRNFVASMLGFSSKAYFEAAAGAEKAPEVKF